MGYKKRHDWQSIIGGTIAAMFIVVFIVCIVIVIKEVNPTILRIK
jgi:hypothetical protein